MGIYRPTGDVKDGLLGEIRESFDTSQLLFEAPIKKQQAWFITQFGTNVNLGNIRPRKSSRWRRCASACARHAARLPLTTADRGIGQDH